MALGDKDVGIFASFFICIATKLCINLYTSKDFREKLQHFFCMAFSYGPFCHSEGIGGHCNVLYGASIVAHFARKVKATNTFANMYSALGHDFVGFLAVFGRHNIRPPHFASKVSYSAAPQTFAEGSRSAAAPERGSYSRIGASPYLSSQLINSRFCPCKGRISR